MTKDRNHQGSTNFDHQDAFADFEPPKTNDGSYKGTMKRKQATAEHLEKKFQEGLAELQQLLKQTKTKVGIRVSGGSIQLQATLPPKPGSDKVKPYQQLISLGIPASLEGLVTAREEAFELGRLLARKQFEWNETYLPVKVEVVAVPTIRELLDKFKDEYFKTHLRNEKTERRMDKYRINRIKRHCDVNQVATTDNFISFIHAVSTPGAKEGLIIAVKVLISTLKLDIDISPVYFTPVRKTRNIPSDSLIEESFCLFEAKSSSRLKQPKESLRHTWKLKSWFYGMLATYGLRPHELITHPDIDWWLSSNNKDDTWKVHKDCKTGAREAFPLNKHWIEMFGLKDTERLSELKELCSQINNCTDTEYAVQNIAQYFKRVGIPFKPYDLRHAWAIRAHMLGVPIKAAATSLGHGSDIHSKTYHREFGRDNTKLAINQAIAKKSEVEELKDEVTKLTIENDRLKIENERYRLMAENPNFMR
jgi:hypothetical protein